MMLVTFKDVLLRVRRSGISKAGNPYAFIDVVCPKEAKEYHFGLFGDDAAALESVTPDVPISAISFSLEPAPYPHEGVNLRPAW